MEAGWEDMGTAPPYLIYTIYLSTFTLIFSKPVISRFHALHLTMFKNIDVKALGTAAVYGAVDIVAEDYTAKNPKTYAGLTPTDISRIAAFAIGVGAPIVIKNRKITSITDNLQAASLPLLEKTIYKLVKNSMKASTGYQANRMVLRSPAAAQQGLTPLLQDNVF